LLDIDDAKTRQKWTNIRNDGFTVRALVNASLHACPLPYVATTITILLSKTYGARTLSPLYVTVLRIKYSHGTLLGYTLLII